MKKYPIPASMLKAVAYLCMLLDHLTGCLYKAHLINLGVSYDDNTLYIVGRAVGRLAFVLFAFMIAEGMSHTHSSIRYLTRLALFALISEVPFDLATSETAISWEKQNTFFTLFAGALSILIIQKSSSLVKNKAASVLLSLLPTLALAALCYKLKSDYGIWGVLFIVLMYITKERYPLMLISGAAALSPGYFLYRLFVNIDNSTSVTLSTFPAWFMKNQEVLCRNFYTEAYGIAALLLIYLYNEKKGNQLPKAFYYFFYPVHLLIIGIIRVSLF